MEVLLNPSFFSEHVTGIPYYHGIVLHSHLGLIRILLNPTALCVLSASFKIKENDFQTE